MSETQVNEAGAERHPVIIIDDVSYEAQIKMTGTELRALADPAIGPDRDLWLEKRDGVDELIRDHEEIDLRTGDRFFSTPRHINPGLRGG